MDAALCKGTKLGVLYGLSQMILQFTFIMLFNCILINMFISIIHGHYQEKAKLLLNTYSRIYEFRVVEKLDTPVML